MTVVIVTHNPRLQIAVVVTVVTGEFSWSHVRRVVSVVEGGGGMKRRRRLGGEEEKALSEESQNQGDHGEHHEEKECPLLICKQEGWG